MARSRTVQKELESLRQELAGLRQDYARLKRRANATTTEASQRFGSIRGAIADAIEAARENVSDGAIDGLTAQLGSLGSVACKYSGKTVRTIAAHPFATLTGAIAVGYLVGQVGREGK